MSEEENYIVNSVRFKSKHVTLEKTFGTKRVEYRLVAEGSSPITLSEDKFKGLCWAIQGMQEYEEENTSYSEYYKSQEGKAQLLETGPGVGKTRVGWGKYLAVGGTISDSYYPQKSILAQYFTDF